MNVIGAIGCDYGSFRLEAEVGYQKSDVKTAINGNDVEGPYEHPIDEQGYNFTTVPWDMNGDVSVLSLMANGYYDFLSCAV